MGLSYNKFLAKIASDLDKPRGFAAIGRAEARSFLAGQPVGLLWGVGAAMQTRLARDGVAKIGELARIGEAELVSRYGRIGRRLYLCARGEDDRTVDPDRDAKSMSSEITLDGDLSDADADALRPILWQLAETVSRRMKKAGIAGGGVTLKLKTSDFRTVTRARKLNAATGSAEEMYRAAEGLLAREVDGRAFRLTENRVLVDHLLKTDLTALAEAMEGTVAQSIVDPENPKTALSVRAMLTAHLGALEVLADDGIPFSIRDWISNEDRSGFLFLTSRADQHASLRGLISTWLEIAVNALLSLDQDDGRRVWIVLDELPTLHQVPSLQPGLAESRQFGGCFVLGIQVISALRDLYGRNGAETVSGLCGRGAGPPRCAGAPSTGRSGAAPSPMGRRRP